MTWMDDFDLVLILVGCMSYSTAIVDLLRHERATWHSSVICIQNTHFQHSCWRRLVVDSCGLESVRQRMELPHGTR
jgi:hypothetical protein